MIAASSRGEGGATNDRVAPVLALDAAREARRFRRSGLRMALGAAAAAAAIAVPLTASFTSGAAPSLAALANRATGEPGAVTVSLKDPAGRAIARAVVTASGKGYMLSDSLPALPAGKTYQLWAVTGADGPVSEGLLGRDPGVSAFTVDAPATALAITVEPAAGSIRGTTTAVALGTTA